MQVTHTSEKLTLLVLSAILATWLGGRQLLERAESQESGVVAAADRTSEGGVVADDAQAADEVLASGVPTELDSGDSARPGPGASGGAAIDQVARGESAPTVRDPSSDLPVRVRGEVTARGERVRASLTWRPVGSSGDEEVRTVETDADDEFAVTLTRGGRHLVHVVPIGFADVVGSNGIELFVDVPHKSVARLPIVLPSGRLSGELVDANGAPVEDAFLELVPDEASFGGASADWRARRTMSDEEGRFRFDFLSPGAYAVSTTIDVLQEDPSSPGEEEQLARLHATSAVAIVAADGDSEVGLRLPEAGRAIDVLTTRDNEPVFGATVYIQRSDAPTLPARAIGTTRRDGRLTLPHFDPALRYQIHARTSDSVSGVVDLTDDALPLELTLSPARRIVLHTRDADGRGVPAFVELVAVDPRQTPWARSSPLDLARRGGGMDTDGPGGAQDLSRHELGPLPFGAYDVRAWTEQGQEISERFSLQPGDGPYELELRFEASR